MRLLRGWPCVFALIAAHAVLLVTCLGTSITAVFWAALVALLVDVVAARMVRRRLLTVLARAGAGLTWRAFVRQLLVVVFVLRHGHLSATATVLLVVAVLAQHAIAGLYGLLAALVRSRRMRRLETRNLPVPGADLPAPPPTWLARFGSQLLIRTEAALLVGLGVAAFGTRSVQPVVAGALVMAVLAAVVPALLVPQLLALRRLPDDAVRLAAAHDAVAALAPLVLLHFSGGRSSVYQVNMWLETMQRLGRPVLVLLRERRYLGALAPTTVPVLCLPFSVDLMNFPMPSARVALYVANVGRNVHLLRNPDLMSAFIGHGDSDKVASFNPATKVYDEVWVAGEAGRERYHRAQVGVRDEDIVLVGRPQLDGIEQVDAVPARPVGAPFTVLYAPTWEGWTEDLNQSSVRPLGLAIVGELLATPGVRLLYKPHPLTGTVDPLARIAAGEIAAAVAAAGAPHEAVLDDQPLFDLFNDSDALVADISSVVSDYLRSGKPYFVTNPAGVPDEEFRELNPSAGAAYLIGPDAAGLADGIARARGADELSDLRRSVRTYLLGETSGDSMTAFRNAVDALAARAEQRDEARRMPLHVSALTG